jgi:hypothetical protein
MCSEIVEAISIALKESRSCVKSDHSVADEYIILNGYAAALTASPKVV